MKDLTKRGELIAVAESCTAGLASSFIAGVPGASKVFWGSFITYTTDAKVRMLGVPEELIKKNGAVSRPVAIAMAEAALKKSGATIAFSITGLAGPEGDGSETPVGTVWIGITGFAGETMNLLSEAIPFRFSGSRNEVREAAVVSALEVVLKVIESQSAFADFKINIPI